MLTFAESTPGSQALLTSLPIDRMTRKQLGAWYTPSSIVRFLVRWAVRTPHDRILDPAVGDGEFLVEAQQRLSAQ